nr:hypothetical protein [uncultured Oscillibacter sp.]
MREIDELRPLTAGRLLELWQACREAGDPLERVLLCNGRILSECCFAQGKRVYGDEAEALADLTGRQMERLLRRLAEGGGPPNRRPQAGTVNPEFDAARFAALWRE